MNFRRCLAKKATINFEEFYLTFVKRKVIQRFENFTLISAATNSKKKTNLTDVIRFIILLGVAVVLLVFAFKGISFRIILNQVLKAKLIWVLLSFFISAVAHLSRAVRWNLLIEPLGYRPPLRKTFYSVMTGYLANLAFPRLGEITRCGSLNKAANVPFNVLLGTVIAERIIDVVSLLICLLITTVIEFKRLGDFLNTSILQPVLQKLKVIASSPLMIPALIILLMILFFSIRYYRSKRKDTNSGKLSNLIKGVAEGFKSVGKLKRPLLFIFHSVLIWFLYYLSVYVALFALPSTESLGLGAALFLLVAGGVAMSAPVQGGIGAYHLLVSQGLILYGLSQQDGLAFATLLHSLQIILMVVFGSASVFLLFLDRKQGETPFQKKEWKK